MEAHSRVEKAPKYYLHTTRSLPFLCAEHIAMICLYSLWKFVSKIPFSPSNFVNSFQHFLRKLENLQKTSCRHWTGNSAIYEKYSMPSCKVDAVCKIEVICGHGKKGKISKKDTEEVTVEGKDELPSREYEEKGKQLLTKYREIRKKMMIKDSEDVKSLKEDDKFIKVEGAANNKRDKRWNLRDRKSFQLTKAVSPNLIAGLPSKAVREKDKQPKSGKGKKEKQEEEDLPKLPNFSLELKLEEISEDLFAVMGKMPSRKMNKRKKNVQKQIDLIFPGGNLEAITVDRYKVSGNTRKAK